MKLLSADFDEPIVEHVSVPSGLFKSPDGSFVQPFCISYFCITVTTVNPKAFEGVRETDSRRAVPFVELPNSTLFKNG